MSNCVEILDGRVCFLRERFDVAEFVRRCNLIEGCAGPNAKNLDSGCDEKYWWWFLSSNYEVLPSGSLIVRLGEGRSGHSFRDLRWTMNQLAQYVNVHTHIDLLVEDMENPGTFVQPFDLKPPAKER